MFRNHKQFKDWCDPILKEEDSPIKNQMDVYYICLMTAMGLGLDQTDERMRGNLADVYKGFTMEFDRSSRNRIAGLFLVNELKNASLPLDNKEILKNKIEQIIDNEDGNTFLNSDAIDKMNIYAYNGFTHIKEKFTTAPASHNFLLWYYKEIMPKLFK